MASNNSCPLQTVPLDQSRPINQGVIFNLNYTCQDFWSLKSRMVDYLRQNFGTMFNDFIESDLAIMMTEIQSFIGDTLSFKIDQNANEPFIDTVTEVENAFRIAKAVGFNPQPPIAARSLWQATINSPLQSELVIPSPMDVPLAVSGQAITIELFPADANNNPVFDQNIIIPPGSIQNYSIVGLEGKTFTDSITGTGDISQTIQLGFFPVIWDSIRVSVDGRRWSQVEYFTDSQRRPEFRIEFNSQWQAFIIFGNNRAGMIPSQGSQIIVTYRVGGGTSGNIVTNFVETQRILSIDGLNFPIPVSFRNYTKGQFGYDGDTIDDIRRKLPAYLRTQNRAVTGLDYKTLADQFATPYNGQVGKSTAVLRNYGCAGNVIDLYVLARNGTDGLTEAQNELKVDLQDYMENLKMLTDFLCIRDGSVVITDVSIDVTIGKFYRKFEDEIKERINRKVNQFFALSSWDYGQSLRDSDLIKSLSDIKEVTGFDISFVTNVDSNSGSVITARFNEIIRPDVITLSFMYV